MVVGISSISVVGFKSLVEEHPIEIRPLTIFAGANSSGKSSIMQPLLMMKQTLHESYDPGDLKINGPNAKFTKLDQFLSKHTREDFEGKFKIQISLSNDLSLIETFSRHQNKGVKISEAIYINKKHKIILRPNMTQDEIFAVNPDAKKEWKETFQTFRFKEPEQLKLEVERNRCFLKLMAYGNRKIKEKGDGLRFSYSMFTLDDLFEGTISKIIHVPALRGNPKRDYDIAATGPIFPGTFENYVASIINDWQVSGNDCLKKLYEWLQMLSLAKTITVEQIDDTRAEIRVGLLDEVSDISDDLVSIADVGFGVSQTLPVLVALLKAEQGQLVYIEQPEIHLHPRAQVAMAKILAEAAKKGVLVVVETHSALLLRGIQTVVAKGGMISPENIKLHWFERGKKDGITKITSTELDEAGSFGDWPEDFGDTIISSESEYIVAAESHLMKE